MGTVTLLSLLIAITVHEFAHAWVANLRGDPTAKAMGRLTLNPLAHLDPLGTTLLLITGFGWGKPVPVDPFNLSDPDKDMALVSLAGPGANLFLAFLAGLLSHLPFIHSSPQAFSSIYILVYLNLILAVFNLLPFYPLDGSKIWTFVLPPQLREDLIYFSKEYGLLLLILGLLPLINGQSLIFLIINPITQFFLNLIFI